MPHKAITIQADCFPIIVCPTGPQGPATISVDSEVVSLPPGTAPTVENVGTEQDAIFKFGIPIGATGTVEVSGIQAVLDNAAGTEIQIPPDGAIIFNQVVSNSGTDISYDVNTGIFTINTSGLNDVYMINWHLFLEGAGSADTVTFGLRVGSNTYYTYAPWTEMQLSGSTMAVAASDDPIEVYLTNSSVEEVTLSNIRLQAQINIIGFRQAS